MGITIAGIKAAIGQTGRQVAASAVKNGPTIAVGGGLVAITIAAVWACKKTLDLPDIL